MVISKHIKAISLDGGSLVFHFINTVHNRIENPMPEYLNGIEDLIAWAQRVAVLSVQNANSLAGYAVSNPEKADRFFNKAINARELLYRIFSAIADEIAVPNNDLRVFNEWRSKLQQCLLIKRQPKIGFTESWNFQKEDFNQLLAPIFEDAAALLLANQPDRIRSCPSCKWLFLDRSKNGRRRWCSMKNCGSAVKAREWYHRNKKAKDEAP